MTPDRIIKYIRDFVLLALPSYGFISEVIKDNPDLWLILLFFGMASAPAAFGLYALRQQGIESTESTPTSQSQPPAPSSSPSSSSS